MRFSTKIRRKQLNHVLGNHITTYHKHRVALSPGTSDTGSSLEEQGGGMEAARDGQQDRTDVCAQEERSGGSRLFPS